MLTSNATIYILDNYVVYYLFYETILSKIFCNTGRYFPICARFRLPNSFISKSVHEAKIKVSKRGAAGTPIAIKVNLRNIRGNQAREYVW